MNPITRSWIWEEYLKFISIEHGKYFLEKMYYSNSFVKWRIFSLHFPGCRCSWGTQLPWSSTWCDNASSFLCFSVWKPLAVVEILLSETATCLIPAQWFHHLQPRWQLSLRAPPSPHDGQCSQPGGTFPGTSHLMKSQGLFDVFLTDVCDHTVTIDTVLLSEDLFGGLNSCRKSIYGAILFKKNL